GAAMTAREHIEVESFDCSVRSYPFGHRVLIEVAASAWKRSKRAGDECIRRKVGGEEQVLRRKEHHATVVRMILSGMNQFNSLSAQSDRHPFGINDIGPSNFGEEFSRSHVAI